MITSFYETLDIELVIYFSSHLLVHFQICQGKLQGNCNKQYVMTRFVCMYDDLLHGSMKTY